MTDKITFVSGCPHSGVEWMGRIFHSTPGVVCNKRFAQLAPLAQAQASDPSDAGLATLLAEHQAAIGSLKPNVMYVAADPWLIWSMEALLIAFPTAHAVLCRRPLAEVASWSSADIRVVSIFRMRDSLRDAPRLLGYDYWKVSPTIREKYDLIGDTDRTVLWWLAHDLEIARLCQDLRFSERCHVVEYEDLHHDPTGRLWTLRSQIAMERQFPQVAPEERRLPGPDFVEKIESARRRLLGE